MLNGKAIGNPAIYNEDSGSITWEIPFQSGKLEAVGYDKNDQPVCKNTIETSQAPYSIVAKPYKSNLKDGVSQIELQIVDKAGIPVVSAENEITCQVKGNARFLGMDAGNNKDMGSYKMNKRKTLHGRLLCYIQIPNNKRKSNIQFSSPGLKPSTVNIL
jgi:hypothetical protein